MAELGNRGGARVPKLKYFNWGPMIVLICPFSQ